MATQTYVASVSYNLAGDIEKRADYLKSLVVRNVFSKKPLGMGETINKGYLYGPGSRLSRFYKWTQEPGNYNDVGLPYGRISAVNADISSATIGNNIPSMSGLDDYESGYIFAIGLPDPFWWGLQYLSTQRIGTAADSNWTYVVNDAVTSITITLPNSEDTPRVITVSLASPVYDPTAGYVLVRYILSRTNVVTGGKNFSVRYYLYKVGTGRAVYDALLTTPTPLDPYFPIIPVRLSNQFLSTSYKAAAYAEAVQAYRQMTGGEKFPKLVEKISDNPNLGDIDHAFIVFGVPLNTPSGAGKKYIYEFLKYLMPKQRNGSGAYATWVSSGSAAANARENILDIRGSFNNRVYVGWRFITEVSGAGLGKTGAKVDELWITKHGTITSVGERFRLYWQKTATTYTYLDVIGLGHRNWIGPLGESVVTYAFAAIDDVEESPLILPLHFATWQVLGMVDRTQVATECNFIVFNCEQSVKQQWYETTLFKILLVVVIAVVSVAFTGGAGLGLLGANLALGTALGFTGITAAIVGSVANALAAMILMSLLEPTLDRMFGSMAPVVSAIIMFAIGAAAGSLTSTGTIVIDWSNLLRADNLLAMTQAVGAGITSQVNQDTLKLQQSGLDYQENAQAEINKIQQAFFNEFGYGAGVIDPMMLVDAPKGPIAESSSTFLTRTLMTGSEIAEMSRQLLYEFPAYSLKLPDAFT